MHDQHSPRTRRERLAQRCEIDSPAIIIEKWIGNELNVGKIGDVILTGDKKIDAVIIDVGGFLGIGAKEVAVGFEKLKFMTDKDGNKYLYTNFTKDQLTAQTAYNKGTYAQARDKQRLIVN